MKILFTHSSSFDYQKELYNPIKESALYKDHKIVLPLQDLGYEGMNKDFLRSCDLLIAEVSYPSTGQGIELGWADALNIPVICFYRRGEKPSHSLKKMTDTMMEYKNPDDLIVKLEQILGENES